MNIPDIKKEILLAVTLGDVRGIGPEVAARAVSHHRFRTGTSPLLIGPRGAFGRALALLGEEFSAWKSGKPSTLSPNLSAFDELEITIHSRKADMLVPGGFTEPAETGVDCRTLSLAESGRLAGKSIELAVDFTLGGLTHAVVTAPIDKKALRKGGYHYRGHTEMLQALTGVDAVAMMLVGGALKVTIATTHIPFSEVLNELSPELLLGQIRLTHNALKSFFGIEKPVIGLCALNPHAGEGGMVGDEEERILLPAVLDARKEDMEVKGPMPADTIFTLCTEGTIDAVVALYHDQGMIPIKVHAFGTGVNMTLGLPFIRTSPDHGTALDRAWGGIANEGSMIEALSLAEDLVRFSPCSGPAI